MTSIGGSLAEVAEPVTALLYGKEGSAKTTDVLGLAHLGNVIALNVEGGMKPSALKRRGIPLERVQVWPEDGDASKITFDTIEQQVYIPARIAIEEALAAGNPAPFVGFAVDSFTELAQRFNRLAADESGERDRAKGKQRGRFQVNVEDYGTSTQQIRQLLRMFRDLNLHVFITCLERRDVDENTGLVSYGPALGPAAATDVAGMVDCVIWTQAEELGPNATPFFTGTTRTHENHRAKDRFGALPVRMIEPSAERVIAYIRGELTKANDDRHKAAIAASRPAS